jgi:hypothetical protein
VLEQLGWTMHRVWSLEWQLNPASEQARLLEAVRSAVEAPVLSAPSKSQPAADTGELKATAATAPPPAPSPAPAPVPIQLGRAYARASLQPAGSDFRMFYSNQATPQIVSRLLALLAVEAPILQREATLRVTQCWNGKAFSPKAHERLMAIASDLQQLQRLFLDSEDTLWVSRKQYEQWEGFRVPPDSGRVIDTVPMAERRGALLLIAREALSIDREALLREACLQLTGGSRFTQQQRQGISPALDQLINRNDLVERDGRIFTVKGS